jgi:hypothetical protein
MRRGVSWAEELESSFEENIEEDATTRWRRRRSGNGGGGGGGGGGSPSPSSASILVVSPRQNNTRQRQRENNDNNIHRIRDENFTFAMTLSSLETAVREQIGKLETDSVEKNIERLEQRKECARLMGVLFDLLKREIVVAFGGGGGSPALRAEVHNYASNLATFQKSLKLWKKKEMHMVKQLDGAGDGKLFATNTTPQKTAASPLKKLFVTRAEETDGLLREVEEKLERLRVLSSSGGERNDDARGDIENGKNNSATRKFTFAARQNISPKQRRTNQKVLVCVVGMLFSALFVATFAWLWTNEAEPWIEKSIRENREHLTYEEIVYEPIDHSNNFDS